VEITTDDIHILGMNKEQLRQLYLDDLRTIIDYGGKKKPRVRKVESVWAKIEDTDISLNLNNYENVWVWSDLHFSHKNIINYCDRPFKDVDEMNAKLIENHNITVGKNDLTIWVGDVAFTNDKIANEFLGKLHGDRILIVGNHDIDRKGRLKKLDFSEIHLLYTIDDPMSPLVFTHYPMWNTPYPWINIHGHVHNTSHEKENSLQHINVSVEVLDYTPIHLNTLKNIAKHRLESIDDRHNRV